MSVALLFPGQGAQTVGMGRELVHRSPRAKQLFDRAGSILGFDLLRICTQGPEEVLNQTFYSQPALFVHSFAALQVLQEEQPDLWSRVTAVAGLSLGEYTAVVAAGGLDFDDGLRLVSTRARAMQGASEATPSGMSSLLGLSLEQVQDLCLQATQGEDSFVQPANILCPGNIAISGHLEALDRAEVLAQQAGAMRVVRLAVSGAFHTSIMGSALVPLEAALKQASFSETRVPIYSNVDARPHSDPEEIRDLLARQIVRPVLWESTIRHLLAAGVQKFVEIGAGRVLTGTVKRIERKVNFECFADSM